MSHLSECPPVEKLALLKENRLFPEEREEILRHIAGCNECAVAYTIFASFQCPPPDVLDEAKKADVLRHIAGCNECAAVYSITREIQKAPFVKAKPVFFSMRRLSQAAAVVLLAGASFIGGLLYERRASFFAAAPEAGFAQIVRQFESSPLYWNKLSDSMLRGTTSAQSTRIVGTRGSAGAASVREILTLKNDFDRHLSQIASMSGQGADTILSINGLDIAVITSSDIEICAAFLKGGRVEELHKAEKWLKLDQSVYFSLAPRLPPNVWDRYPLSDESFKTLSWIAGLPEKRKEKILALTPEEAKREMEK